MMDLPTLPDRMVLALTVYGEARGEPVEGQIAVACVVRNRLHAAPAGTTWRALCLAPEQFSCFNADDPNAATIQRAAVALMTTQPPPALAQALWIADGVMSGVVLDPTHGATHYLVTSLLQSEHAPSWAVNQPILVTIGAQSFLKVA